MHPFIRAICITAAQQEGHKTDTWRSGQGKDTVRFLKLFYILYLNFNHFIFLPSVSPRWLLLDLYLPLRLRALPWRGRRGAGGAQKARGRV